MARKQVVEVERSFEQPIEEVFARYTDHEGWSRWAGLGRVRLVREGAPERHGAGSVRAFQLAPGLREEITRYEAPSSDAGASCPSGPPRMDYRVIAGPVPMAEHHGEVLFEREGQGTRIRWRVSFRSRIPGAGGLLRIGLGLLFRRVLARLARDLRRPRGALRVPEWGTLRSAGASRPGERPRGD